MVLILLPTRPIADADTVLREPQSNILVCFPWILTPSLYDEYPGDAWKTNRAVAQSIVIWMRRRIGKIYRYRLEEQSIEVVLLNS